MKQVRPPAPPRPPRQRRTAKWSSLRGAQNTAVRVWVCVNCGCWYGREKRAKNRPVCDLGGLYTDGVIYSPAGGIGCGGTDFVYMASEGQAQRYMQLRMLQDAGQIRELNPRATFSLNTVNPGGQIAHICDFHPDFTYREFRNGEWHLVVEDYKARRHEDAIDRLWLHKRKHFESQYCATVRITTGG